MKHSHVSNMPRSNKSSKIWYQTLPQEQFLIDLCSTPIGESTAYEHIGQVNRQHYLQNLNSWLFVFENLDEIFRSLKFWRVVVFVQKIDGDQGCRG